MFEREDEDKGFDVSDAEVDELMEKFGSDSDSGPTVLETESENAAPVVDTEASADAPVVQDAPKPAAPAPEAEFEFNHNGQMVKAPLSKILKWAQQGYDYPQKMADINRQRQELTGLEDTYKPIDEWVRANPDKWGKLQQVIEAENQGYGDLPPDHPVVQKLSKFESFVSEVEKERQEAKFQKEDKELEIEIQSIREKYKDLDWSTVDENGRDRALNVIAHANKHGFRTFKTAFLDLYHDDLVKSAETRAREQFQAAKEKQTKTGLLAKQAPSASSANLSAPKKNTKSYPTTEEILKEIGIS